MADQRSSSTSKLSSPETSVSPNLKQRKTASMGSRTSLSPQYVNTTSSSFAGLSPSPPPSSRRRPSRTQFMDVRTRKIYTGPRQPHQSRMKKLGLSRKTNLPGPGQYNPGRYTYRKPPRFTFGKAPQRVPVKKNLVIGKDPWEQAGMGRSLLASSMGYQPESTSRSAPSVAFGTATRDQARLGNMPKQFANDRNGMESPGPIYYPQPGKTELYRRYGIKTRAIDGRKTSLVRENQNTKNGNDGRPTTADIKSSLEKSKKLNANRPVTTTFGMSNRPPLFVGETGTPGPGAYSGSYTRSQLKQRPNTSGSNRTRHMEQNKKFSTFGNSTREQRQKVRAVSGTDHYGKDSPGPGAYFTNQEVRDLCDSATGYVGPKFTAGCVTPFGSMFEKTQRLAERQKRSASLIAHGFSDAANEEKFSKAEPGPSTYQSPRTISTLFKTTIGKLQSAPTISFSMTPRFGNNNGLSPRLK
eukprot:g2227.t1